MLLVPTMSDHSSAPASPQDTHPMESNWLGLNIAFELGYTIAIPAVCLGFLGAYLDRHLVTSPFFLICGFFIAFFLSAASIARKIRGILRAMPQVLSKKPDPVDLHASEGEQFHDSLRPKS